MNLLFSRIEALDGQLENYELTEHNRLSRDQFDLIYKSYLYTVYYYPIATGEISEEDLSYFNLFDPPFSKAVFILQKGSDYYKLNYSISPMEYYISEFNPETNESNLITDQSRELYGVLRSMLKYLPWDEYARLYRIGAFTTEEHSEESMLLDHSGLMLGGQDANQFADGEGLMFSGGDDAELELAPTGIAPVNEEQFDLEESAESTSGLTFSAGSGSTNQFDKLPIKQRRIKLEQFQDDLKNAHRIAEIKGELKSIQQEIKRFEGVKQEITKRSVAISKKEDHLDQFRDIKWISEEIYKSLLGYDEAKKKYHSTQEMITNHLANVERDIENIQHDDITSNKIFLASFVVGTLSYILSWIARDPLRWLAILAIIAFTVSVYYLWGYIDYLDHFRRLRRRRTFLKKKRVEETEQFQKDYAQVDRLMRQHSIKELPPILERASGYFALLSDIEKSKDQLDDYCMKHFNEKLQEQFKQLLADYQLKEKELARFSKKDLNVEEITYLINTLKESIKKYEKKELEEFSLDDDPIEEPEEETPEIPEEEPQVVATQTQLFEAGYSYLKRFETFFMVSPEQIFQMIEPAMLPLLQHYGENQMLLRLEDRAFQVVCSEQFTLQGEWSNDLLHLMQLALILSSVEKNPMPLFLDHGRFPETTKITAELLSNLGIQHQIFLATS